MNPLAPLEQVTNIASSKRSAGKTVYVEERLVKNDMKNSKISIIIITEMITYFKDKNRKSKKLY